MDVSKVANNVTGYMEAIAVSRKQHMWCIAVIGQPKAKFSYIIPRASIPPNANDANFPLVAYTGLKVQRGTGQRIWGKEVTQWGPGSKPQLETSHTAPPLNNWNIFAVWCFWSAAFKTLALLDFGCSAPSIGMHTLSVHFPLEVAHPPS